MFDLDAWKSQAAAKLGSQPTQPSGFDLNSWKAKTATKLGGLKIGDAILSPDQVSGIEKDGDNSERLLLAVEKRRSTPEQFGLSKKQGWGSYVAERLPFYAHGLLDKAKAAKDAATKLEAPDKMDQGDIDNIANVIVEQELRGQEDSEKGLFQKGLDIATHVPALGTEIALTLGGAAVAKNAAKQVAKKGVERLLPTFVSKALQSGLEKVSGKYASKLAGMAATSAIATQHPLMAPKNVMGTAERMLPTVQDGKVVPGESVGNAYFNNSLDQTVELFTEQLGGDAIGKLGKLSTGSRLGQSVAKKVAGLSGYQMAVGLKNSAAKWLGERVGLKVPEALKVLADKAKYHGVIGEMMEERYGENIRAASDAFFGTNISDGGGVTQNLGSSAYNALKGEYGDAADNFVGALAQLAVEGIGFGLVSGAGRAAGFAGKAAGVGYEHSPEFAQKWAEQNPQAAQLLATKKPDELSRTLFASLGLPVNTGKESRQQFQGWIKSPPQQQVHPQPDGQPRQEQPAPADQQPEISQASIPSPDEMGPVWKDNILESLKTWQNKGTPDQLRAHLLKTKGTKEYADYIGLDDFLEGKASVTKQEVEKYVKDNQVDLQEVVLGEKAPPLDWSKVNDNEQDAWTSGSYSIKLLENGTYRVRDIKSGLEQSSHSLDAAKMAVEEWRDHSGKNKTPTKYEQYKTPGGKDYREFLITLPEKSQDELDQKIKSLHQEYKKSLLLEGNEEEISRIESELSALKQKKSQSEAQYHSSHFNEKNILAHVRFDTREVGGKKVLFLDEVQSDWHQEGREKGYKGGSAPLPKEIQIRPIEVTVSGPDGDRIENRYMVSKNGAHRGGPFLTAADAESYAYELADRQSVPDAPHKTTWPMLAIRRMIRYAVENGYDSIAFTTGEMQAERYDLSKQVSSIEYSPSENSLLVWDKDGAPIIGNETRVAPDEVQNYIGKEAAERLLSPDSEDQDGVHRLEPEDLKLGGEGMKGFYDQILPAEINKFLKKYGGKVVNSEIPGSDGHFSNLDRAIKAIEEGKALIGRYGSKVKAIKSVNELNSAPWEDFMIEGEQPMFTAHSFDIPEKLREEAIGGMTKFAENKPQPQQRSKKQKLSGTPGETATGKDLIKQMKQENSKVGLRSMTDFLASAFNALMVRTTSQVSTKHPAHYIGGRMTDKGKVVLPAYHVIFSQDGRHDINFHELGHTLSSIFKNTDFDKYQKWLGYWQDALIAMSNQGFSSVPDSLEEGMAEAMRYYIQDQSVLELEQFKAEVDVGEKKVKKTFLEGINELLDGMAPEEAKAFRDAHRMFLIHDAKDPIEKTAVEIRDKGFQAKGLGKSMQRKWHDFLTGLYGNTIPVQVILKKAYENVSDTKQFGIANTILGVAKLASKDYRDKLAAAEKFFQEVKDSGGDIESAYNNIARIHLEASRIVHQGITDQKGFRFFASGNMQALEDVMKSLHDADLPYSYAISGVDGQKGTASQGDYVYLLDSEGNQIPLYHEVKSAIGDKWERFEAYGQNKTTVARITKHPEWDYPGKGLVSIKEMAESVAAEEKANPEFLENYKKVEKLMDALLSLSVISGELPIEEAVRIKDAYDHYWPQQRDVNLRSSNEKKGGGSNTHFDYEIDRAYGSGLPFKRLDDIVFNRVIRSLNAYNYGRMLDTFLSFRLKVAKKLTGKYKDQVEWMQQVIPIGPEYKAVDIPKSKEAEIIANYLNQEEAKKLGMTVEELIDGGLAYDPSEIEISTPSTPLWKEANPNMVQVVRRRRGDTIQYFHMPDPFTFQIFEGNPALLEKESPFTAIAEILGSAIAPFKRVVTRSPTFAIYNALYRDPRTTLITGKSFNPYHNTMKAVVATIRGSMPGLAKKIGLGSLTQYDKEASMEMYSLYSQNTAPISGLANTYGQKILGSFKSMLTEGYTHKEGIPIDWSPNRVGWWKVANSAVGAAFSTVLKPMDVVNWASGGWYISPRGEAMTRAGAYISAREQGATMEQAVMAADNSTANFNQRSHSKYARVMDKQAMFFNARLQVGYQLYKQLFDKNPYVRGTAVLKLGYSSVMHGGMLAAIVLGIKAIGDDELNKWIEDWLKKENERTDSDKMRAGSIPLLNGLSLKIPFDDGIPSMLDSFGWNTALSHLAEAKSRGETIEEAASGIMARATSMLGPSLSQLMNPLVRTAIESNINFKFYNNSRIIPDGVASIYEKKQQTLPSTPESYNQAAEWLDKYSIEVSPLKLRHIVSSIGMRYLDQVAAFKDKKTAKEAGDLPLFGQLFTKEPKGFSSQSVLSLSEMERKFDSAKKELEKLSTHGTEAEKEEAYSRLVSLRGYKAWWSQVYSMWDKAKKLRDAGLPEEALQMERMMTETARRGLKEAALLEEKNSR